MSGHSKFANIKHKKEKNDAAKGKIFTIIGKEIAVAVKEGGPNPANNFKLATVIAKAKANNMPNDTIERGIKNASGADGAVDYKSITYEGYGPGGTAIIVEALTDNSNRTAANVKSAFTKGNGNVGTGATATNTCVDGGYFMLYGGTGETIQYILNQLVEIQNEFDEFKEGGFEEYYEAQLDRWIRDNMEGIIGQSIKMVFFGLTQNGHFVAYIADSWKEIRVDTGIVYNLSTYGRLILRMDVDSPYDIFEQIPEVTYSQQTSQLEYYITNIMNTLYSTGG